MTIALAVIICGTLSTAAYEQLNVRDRGCGDLITFCEYTLVVLLHGKYLLKEPKRVPLSTHLVVLSGFVISRERFEQQSNSRLTHLAHRFLGYSLLCNFALSLALPVTVLLIFKNGNMVADVVLGTFALKRKYPLLQIGAVLAVSMGITAAALETRKAISVTALENSIDVTSFATGCTCIVLALFLRAGSGVAQELIFKQTNGKVQEELLAWRSAIGLPILCLTRWSNIVEHASIWMTGGPSVSFLGFDISILWIFMLCNMIFDYATKILVGELIFRTSALSTSLVLILMRFISIVFSSCYVNAPPYPGIRMLAACTLVISGTLVYTNCELEKKSALREKRE